MNFKDLYEGVEPTLPGAPKGIKVMTPQQFVAKQGNGEPGEQDPEKDIDENTITHGVPQPKTDEKLRQYYADLKSKKQQGVAEGEVAQHAGPIVLVHKAYRDNIIKAKEALQRFHAVNPGPKLEIFPPSGRYGPDYYEFHLAPKPYNSIEAIKSTLKGEGVQAGVVDGQQNMAEGASISGDGGAVDNFKQQMANNTELDYQKGMAEGSLNEGVMDSINGIINKIKMMPGIQKFVQAAQAKKAELIKAAQNSSNGQELVKNIQAVVGGQQAVAEGWGDKITGGLVASAGGSLMAAGADVFMRAWNAMGKPDLTQMLNDPGRDGQIVLTLVTMLVLIGAVAIFGGGMQIKKGMNEDLNRIRKLSGLNEADLLGAPTKPFGGQDFQDYMARIAGTPDIDKKTGEVKLDKKGKEKYVSGKTKQDKYKMPYIHRSSVIKYYNADGKRYDEDQVKQALGQRPKKLLKQNEKMKHSNGDLEQFFNVGFAALVGIALDEDNKNLVIVNTCPGAGSCKIDCFAMKGGKIQFEAAWLSDGRILTYLLNDPDGFFNQLSSEISREEKDGKKGGYSVAIRWHDAGDFFSPEYVDMAFKLAKAHPDVNFYAYTKMGDVAIGNKPANFMINWSEGANTTQEKKVKSQDPTLASTKNSRIVPEKTFDDLLVKNEKGNLVKGSEGQWQVQPDKLPELKQRLAQLYGLSANSILSYDEWATKGKNNPMMKWNVIVTPGEPDVSATDPGVLSTLLLRH